MKIQPLMTNVFTRKTSFRQNFDLVDKLQKCVEKQIGDTFEPCSPSQPIIIEKLEINTNDKKKSPKEQIMEEGKKIVKGVGVAGVGAGVAQGVSAKKDGNTLNNGTAKVEQDSAKELNPQKDDNPLHNDNVNPEQEAIKDIDLDKLIDDKAAEENASDSSEESIVDIVDECDDCDDCSEHSDFDDTDATDDIED